MKKRSKTSKAMRDYFTKGIANRPDDEQSIELPDAIVEQIPTQETTALAALRRWFTDYVDGVIHEFDIAALQRFVEKLNLKASFWDALQKEAEARRSALEIEKTISARAAGKERDKEYEISLHQTRMSKQDVERQRLKKQARMLSKSPRKRESDPTVKESVGDRITRALSPLAEMMVSGRAEVLRIAKEARDAAEEQGEDENGQQRVYRKTYNMGMRALEELARENTKPPDDDRSTS